MANRATYSDRMTNTTTAPAPVAYGSTTTFHADDFAAWLPKFSTPHRRSEWTLGLMRYIVAALDGVPCLIEVDTMSHHTVVAYLTGTLPGGGGRLPRVMVRYYHGAGCTEAQAPCPRTCPGYHETAHYLMKLGAITPLPTDTNRAPVSVYDVFRTLHEHGSVASKAVHEAQAAESGAPWYGKIDTRPSEDGLWWVDYESQVREGQNVPTGYADPYQRASFTVNPLTGEASKQSAYDYRRR